MTLGRKRGVHQRKRDTLSSTYIIVKTTNKAPARITNPKMRPSYLAEGAQRIYMHPTLFPRLERVRNTSVASSSRWEYWNSARSVRWSFQRPSPVALPPPIELPPLPPPPRERKPDVPVGPAGTGPASRSGRRAQVGSGGRKASLAAIRLGQGGQQNRQHSSLTERPFIVSCKREDKRTWSIHIQHKQLYVFFSQYLFSFNWALQYVYYVLCYITCIVQDYDFCFEH